MHGLTGALLVNHSLFVVLWFLLAIPSISGSVVVRDTSSDTHQSRLGEDAFKPIQYGLHQVIHSQFNLVDQSKVNSEISHGDIESHMQVFHEGVQHSIMVPSKTHMNTPIFQDDPLPPPKPLPTYPTPSAPPLDVFPISVIGGLWWQEWPIRIQVAIFSEGYMSTEEDKFKTDANELVKAIISPNGLGSVGTLFNFWGAFSPSNDSGIGSNGMAKDSLFGVARTGDEDDLDALSVQHRVPLIAACLYGMQRRCSYAIVLANSPLYGYSSILETYSVMTTSPENRVRLVRDITRYVAAIGSEEDGSPDMDYFGPNSEIGVNEDSNLKWEHWLNDDSSSHLVEKAVMSARGDPHIKLRHDDDFKFSFRSPGNYSRYELMLDISGIENEDQLQVTMDGRELRLKAKGGSNRIDRREYTVQTEDALSSGKHQVVLVLRETASFDAWLYSYEVLEFGDDAEFNRTAGHISAYPTFSSTNTTTYRPTNSGCVMRNSHSTTGFCSPCKEAFWKNILSRVLVFNAMGFFCYEPNDIIDDYYLDISIDTIPVGIFRPGNSSIPGEALTIEWSLLGKPYEKHANKTTVIIPDRDILIGKIVDRVKVQFSTPEVRDYTPKYRFENSIWGTFVGNWTCREVLTGQGIGSSYVMKL